MFLRAACGQLSQGLYDAGEQFVLPDPVALQVGVHGAHLPVFQSCI